MDGSLTKTFYTALNYFRSHIVCLEIERQIQQIQSQTTALRGQDTDHQQPTNGAVNGSGGGDRIGFAQRGHYDRELYDAAQTPRSKYEGYDLSIATNEADDVSLPTVF